MNNLSSFFLLCSGVHDSILKKCPTDVNKYIGIGATIFFTGVLAFIASSYAIYTIFDSWIISCFFGLVWGLMIFNLDRYIVSSMKRQGSVFRDFFTALPRIVLAVIIAIVISKPLELKIFEKEINAELITMEQETFRSQEDKVKERYTTDIANWQNEIKTMKSEIELKRNKRDELALIAQQESDGTGGSKQKNLGPIYKAKKLDADHADQELDAALALGNPIIAQNEQKIKDYESKINNDIAGLTRSAYGGFAARIDALSRLSDRSRAIFIASLFIMLLFIAIETAPIFVKLISNRSPYDYVLHKHEHVFVMNHKERNSILTAMTQNKINEEVEIGNYRSQSIIRSEKQLIEHAVKEEVERLKKEPAGWKEFWKSGRFLHSEGQ